MEIKRVNLIGSGFKGLEVVYLREEEKSGRKVVNEIKEKRRHPVHLGLETMFRDLRYYLLDIGGYLNGGEDKMEKDYKIMETEVIGIEIGVDGFVLIGEKVVFPGKVMKIKTPRVEEGDGYDGYDVVMGVLRSIVDEVKLYLSGGVVVDDVEVAVRYVQMGKSRDVTPEKLGGMSPEELKEFAVRLLENNFGAVVMMDDEREVGVSVEDVVGLAEEVSGDLEIGGDMEELVISPAF